MNPQNNHVKQSARVMRIMGWSLLISMVPAVLVFPNGFLWGSVPLNFPLICFTHDPSPLNGLHPYIFMIAVIYAAWCILLIRGARHPVANAALFDFGILANLLHAVVMVPMAFVYPNEWAHLYMDIPLLLAVCAVLWVWHPNRGAAAVAHVV